MLAFALKHLIQEQVLVYVNYCTHDQNPFYLIYNLCDGSYIYSTPKNEQTN